MPNIGTVSYNTMLYRFRALLPGSTCLIVTPSRNQHIDQIRDLFQRLNWQGRQQLGRRLEAFGVTVPQFLVLKTIQRLGPEATMSDVGDALQVPRSSMTSHTDRLVELRLVDRSALEHDRRAVAATVTESGAELVRAVEASNRDVLDRMLAGLSDDDVADLVRLLAWMRDGLDREASSPAGTGPS